jgi:(E)-4-hydroxy-3-methylbut-2-enyl-diphosphate synthase
VTVQDFPSTQQPIAIASPLPRKSRQARVVWRNNVVTVGGDAPVRVLSLTTTDRVEGVETAFLVGKVALAGSVLVRNTFNTPLAGGAVP